MRRVSKWGDQLGTKQRRSPGCAFVTVASPRVSTRCCHIVTREAKSAIPTLKELTEERGATDANVRQSQIVQGQFPQVEGYKGRE